MEQGGWSGRIHLEHAGGLFLGVGGETPVHAHHAFKIVISLEGTAGITSSVRGPLRGRLVVVHPNEPHAVLARDCRLALIFVEPHSLLGRCIDAEERSAPGSLCTPESADRLAHALLTTPEGTLPSTDVLLGDYVQKSRPRCLDPRVRRAIERLGLDGAIEEKMPDLAQSLGLSPSRFCHLFGEAFGISPVRYRRWRHLRRAMGELVVGVSVTDAAHASGFSDAAHLCRTFVQMMGITPGMFRQMELVPTTHSYQQIRSIP